MDDRTRAVGRLIEIHRAYAELVALLDRNRAAAERARRYLGKPGANRTLAQAAIDLTRRRRAELVARQESLRAEAEAAVEELPDVTPQQAAVLWAGC